MRWMTSAAVLIACLLIFFALLARTNDTDSPATKHFASIDPSDLFKATLCNARAGDAEAQYSLGIMYSNGQGVPQNTQDSIQWLTKAAEQGHIQAQYMLGIMYELQDYAVAVRWFIQAAELGHAESQYILGIMYLEGKRIDPDYVQARKWLDLSAQQGYEPANDVRLKLTDTH